ncbi:MAG: AAC(3) family N-acetyltransferase [Treponema sp.]|nr:AAC(3) family N-acetyltransferase [Treponema sp.]
MCLFTAGNGQELTYGDFLTALREIGASDCRTLFVHSDIQFGQMNPVYKRREFMESLLRLFDDLKVENIIMPAFTYSFNNEKEFDVRTSRSLMGALSESFRKQEGIYRTLDPMCSFAVKGRLADEFRAYTPEHNSLGPGSCYDFLNKQDGVKYLFFGADLAESFTYVHHVERMIDVPYRFDKTFAGRMTGYDGNTYTTDWTISSQCGGVALYDKNEHFKKQLVEEGKLRLTAFGDRELSCISQEDAWKAVEENIARDKFYFLARPYTEADLTHEYVMKQDGKPVTHC